MKPLISIVVPVYNVEKVFHYCVDSLLNQDYPNIEIILVNDGSKDKSGEICDEYASRYRNIKVLHKENGGQSSARNLGLKYIQGDYVGFLDSDDAAAPDMYSYLYHLMCEYDCDVASIDIHEINDHEIIKCEQPTEYIEVKRGKDILLYFMERTTKADGYSVCRCLFKKEVLDGISFREGKFYEDIDYKFLALKNATGFVDSNQKKYFYLQSQTSTSLAGFKRKDYDLLTASEILLKYCKQTDDPKVIYYADIKLKRVPFSLLSRIAYIGFADPTIHKEEEKKITKEFTQSIRRNFWLLIKAPIPISRKCVLCIMCIDYRLLKLPLRVYKRLKALRYGNNSQLTG